MVIQIPKLKCQKCSHEWIPRKVDVRACPSCQTRLWDRYKERRHVGVNGGSRDHEEP